MLPHVSKTRPRAATGATTALELQQGCRMRLEPANEEHAEHEFVHVSTEPGHA